MFLVKPHLTAECRPSPISWSISRQSPAPLAGIEGVSHNPLSPEGTSRIPMSYRLNQISPLKGCGINPAIALSKPNPAPPSLGIFPTAGLGRSRSCTGILQGQDRASTTCLAPARTNTDSTADFLLCFAKLLRKLAQNQGCCLLFLPEQGSDVAPSFPKVLPP